MPSRGGGAAPDHEERPPTTGVEGALRTLRPLVIFAGFVLVTAVLYWARPVLMPVALAVVFAFLLSPVVGALQRRLGRVVSLLLVVVLGFSVLGGITWIVATQVASLADELPKYRANIRKKISVMRGAGKDSSLDKMQSTVKDVIDELQKPDERKARPQEVIVRDQAPPDVWSVPGAIKPYVEPLATAGLVVVLVVFMLAERQELRNRIIRLVGYGRLTLTTKALDEAALRITRYLVMQSLINTTYGVALGLGFFLIGVPYAVLLGFLAAVLRFIPYIGPWLGFALPAVLSLGVFPGWTQPLLVLALFVVVEIVVSSVVEPLLYGQSAGLSQVALLVAIAFWTWLWGPIGLLLATPLTVCLVVLGKYVPQLDFITILLSDEPVLDPDVAFYQRLLAGDLDEAADIVEEHVKTHPVEQVYDEVLVAALAAAHRDGALGRLDPGDLHVVYTAAREVVDDLDAREGEIGEAARARDGGAAADGVPRARVLGLPTTDEADELALVMLRQLLSSSRCEMEVLSSRMLSAEMLERVRERPPSIVCIGGLRPGGGARARYLAKRLHARFPDVKILVGRWGQRGTGDAALFRAPGVEDVGTTLRESRDHVLALCQVAGAETAAEPAPAAVKSSAA
jgi:predicted PurR-regulated permease PerM